MGLEAATTIDGLVETNPVGATDTKATLDDHIRLIKAVLKLTMPGLSGRLGRVQAKSSGYTAVAADNWTILNCTGSWTLAMTAVATIGNGFALFVVNSGTGTVTVDPNSTELVNGAATLALPPGYSALLLCDGTGWVAVLFFTGTPAGLSVTLSDDGAAAGPFIDLKRISASPAASDILGRLRWYGKTSGASDIIYAYLDVLITDITLGSEDAKVQLYALTAGSTSLQAEWAGGVQTAGVVPLARMNRFEGSTGVLGGVGASQGATTEVATLDCGTVVVGDMILASGYAIYTKGNAAGIVSVNIVKSSGTATIDASVSGGGSNQPASSSQNSAVAGLIKVTGAGTLVLGLNIVVAAGGTNGNTSGELLRALVLKGAS